MALTYFLWLQHLVNVGLSAGSRAQLPTWGQGPKAISQWPGITALLNNEKGMFAKQVTVHLTKPDSLLQPTLPSNLPLTR